MLKISRIQSLTLTEVFDHLLEVARNDQEKVKKRTSKLETKKKRKGIICTWSISCTMHHYLKPCAKKRIWVSNRGTAWTRMLDWKGNPNSKKKMKNGKDWNWREALIHCENFKHLFNFNPFLPENFKHQLTQVWRWIRANWCLFLASLKFKSFPFFIFFFELAFPF